MSDKVDGEHDWLSRQLHGGSLLHSRLQVVEKRRRGRGIGKADKLLGGNSSDQQRTTRSIWRRKLQSVGTPVSRVGTQIGLDPGLGAVSEGLVLRAKVMVRVTLSSLPQMGSRRCENLILFQSGTVNRKEGVC